MTPVFRAVKTYWYSVVINTMSDNVNILAAAAAGDDNLRESFIVGQEQLILSTASRASYRYITKSDDEWSIALCAFSDAIDRYDPSQGDFVPFARMLMKRALIDFHRKTAAHLTEVSTSPFVLEGTEDAEEADEWSKSVYLAVSEQSRKEADRDLREEITAANEMLQQYGFRFFELTACSPQQEKTKQECARAIRFVLADRKLLEELEKSRKIPARAVSAGSGVSRKTMDRYRKYIIMAVLVLHGDFPKLSEYLKFVWKEESA